MEILSVNTTIGTFEMSEKIISAAIKQGNTTYALGRPLRHHHIFREYGKIIHEDMIKGGIHIQGFMTSHGRFVDRKEGLKIATEQNQIIEKHPSFDELYSEDMW